MTISPAAIAPPIQTLVRKDKSEEALVTQWRELPDLVQEVVATWPQSHAFYTEGDHFTPLLFTESLRQALALLSHRVHSIPLGHRLGWEQISSWILPTALDVQGSARKVTLLVSHPSVTRRRMGSVYLVSRIDAVSDGRRIGGAEVRYSAHPPAIYDRLRGPYSSAKDAFSKAIALTPPVDPALVGRSSTRNVVLTPLDQPLSWQLRVDTTHSVLFDHPHDHVPGMVLLEAAAQAAQASLPTPVATTRFDTQFLRYVEFDQPCTVTADPAPDGVVHVTVTQSGTPVFTSAVTTEPWPAT
ncbi:ScbA/BarX family gamma-butyrolactone biosynthesis protein [Kribbella sp. NPDC058245]|uniref:ScbA/BarX family gamma-butyrolactone biosynthesis protein n=1 Tax=Kribbella sp. NPDC058245 TaxID=3346399 RepID=UPI0036EB2B3C